MKEHDVVEMLRDLDYEQIPKGSQGTIVHVTPFGALVIEFNDLNNKIITVRPEHVKVVWELK